MDAGSPWDEDKAMMGRWGLEGMASFEQPNVARKEGARLREERAEEEAAAPAPMERSTEAGPSV